MLVYAYFLLFSLLFLELLYFSPKESTLWLILPNLNFQYQYLCDLTQLISKNLWIIYFGVWQRKLCRGWRESPFLYLISVVSRRHGFCAIESKYMFAWDWTVSNRFELQRNLNTKQLTPYIVFSTFLITRSVCKIKGVGFFDVIGIVQSPFLLQGRTISKTTKRSCGVFLLAQTARWNDNCGRANGNCFTTTVHLFTTP